MSKEKGRKFERKVAHTIGSGNLWFDKCDLKVDNCVIECKYTDKKGFRITTEILEKLWDEALSSQKEPRFVLGIKRNDNEIFLLTATLQIQRK